jgi:hypothetical protein
MWESVSFIRTRQTNPRTEIQSSQRRQFFEFDRNWTRKAINIWSNRMARTCEKACLSCQQDKPIHVPRYSRVNDVSSLSSIGIEPVSRLESDQVEWQRHVSKRDMLTTIINQYPYRDTVESTTSVFRVRSELNPLVDYMLMEENGKDMWESVSFMRTRQTNPRTEIQPMQQRQLSEFVRNWAREFIITLWNRMARKCEQAEHAYE